MGRYNYNLTFSFKTEEERYTTAIKLFFNNLKDMRIVRFCVEQLQLDPMTRNLKGKTALDIARKYGNVELYQYLMECRNRHFNSPRESSASTIEHVNRITESSSPSYQDYLTTQVYTAYIHNPFYNYWHSYYPLYSFI